MPEGDTIFRTARSLGRALVGKPITGFRSTYPLLTRFHDDTPLTGQTVDRVESRGKWLLIHFSGGATLATHMLMNGSWHHLSSWRALAKAGQRHAHRDRESGLSGGCVSRFRWHGCTPRSPWHARSDSALGLDVLSEDFDPEAAAARMRAYADEEIGDVLLHQQVLAGVGNVFKSEICFVTGVNPFCRVAALTREADRCA